MAKNDLKGITIELNGDTSPLEKAIGEVTSTSISLQRELKGVERALKFDPGNAILAAQQQDILKDNIESTAEKLDTLRKAQSQVEAQFKNGKIEADEYRAFQRELLDTEKSLTDLQKKLDDVNEGKNAKKVENSFDDIGKSAKDSESKVSKAGKAIAKSFAAMAAAGVGAVGGLVTGMNELNTDLAALKTNAKVAGVNMEFVNKSFEKASALTGETDSTIEALSNVMAAGFKDEKLSETMELISGAAVKFKDTLKLEGIADGLQETLATGQAIGPFSELLDRSSYSLDTFNKGLEQAKKNGTEQQYVLDVMNKIGLREYIDTMKEVNPEITAYNEANSSMKKQLADLALTLTPLVTMVISFVSSILTWTNANLNLSGSFSNILSGLAGALPAMLTTGATVITNVISGIAQQIPLLILKISEIGNNLTTAWSNYLPKMLEIGTNILKKLIDGIVSVIPSLLRIAADTILKTVKTILDNLPKFLESGKSLIKKLVEGIKAILPDVLKTGTKLIIDLIGAIIKKLPDILKAGAELIWELIKGILSIDKEVGRTIREDIIPQIRDTLKNIDWKQLGKDIINGLIKGISNMTKFVVEKVTDVGNSILNGFKKVLGIASPSKEAEKIGKWTSQGLTRGIQKEGKKTVKTAKELAAEIKTAFNKDLSSLKMDFKAEKIDLSKYIASLEKMKDEYGKTKEYRQKIDVEIVASKKKQQAEIDKVNQAYLKNVQDLNKKLVEEENKLNEEYKTALDNRANVLYSFVGLFDQVTTKEITGTQLVENLQGQLDAFSTFTENLGQLASRGVAPGLIEELQTMGVNAASEIAALNTLSDEQLIQYVSMWQEKHRLAKEQATTELEGMRVDTDKKIQDLRATAAAQLKKYQYEWKTSMKEITGNAKTAMSEMPSIGEYAISGLISGMNSKRSELIATAQSIASIVASAFSGVLDINSPSRVFRGFGININEGLIQGLKSNFEDVTKTMGQYDIISSDAQRMLYGNSQVGTASTTNNSTSNSNNIINNTFVSPKALTPYETARQNKIALKEMGFGV